MLFLKMLKKIQDTLVEEQAEYEGSFRNGWSCAERMFKSIQRARVR